MPTFTPQSYITAVEKLNRDLQSAQIALALAKRGQQIAEQVASGDLGGDPKFSGWAPVLETQVRPSREKFGAVMLPTKVSAGPWTVAEQGRNMGETGAVLGPGVNRRTGLTSRTKSGGLRKVRTSRGRRWNGYTDGKRTASKAVARIEAETKVLAATLARRAVAKTFDVS